MDKTKLIVVAGPTASGKTALAVQIAKAVGGSVICADSMQVYKGMSIATAAPAKQEMQGVPHMLNEFLERSVSFSVSDFCDAAKDAVEINELLEIDRYAIANMAALQKDILAHFDAFESDKDHLRADGQFFVSRGWGSPY